jgi:hypothetical protein
VKIRSSVLAGGHHVWADGWRRERRRIRIISLVLHSWSRRHRRTFVPRYEVELTRTCAITVPGYREAEAWMPRPCRTRHVGRCTWSVARSANTRFERQRTDPTLRAHKDCASERPCLLAARNLCGRTEATRVWHRDLKPENILYDPDADHVVVADFGIAHFAEPLLQTTR